MSGLDDIFEWDVEQMIVWLQKESLHECVKPFSLKKINGRSLLNFSESDFKSLAIPQESRRKLSKALEKIKAKRRNVQKRFGNDQANAREWRKPPSFCSDEHGSDDSENDGWATDDFDSGDEAEDSDDGPTGDYIEPVEDDLSQVSPAKEVPNIAPGLVAQLRAGLANSISRNSLLGGPPPVSHSQASGHIEQDESDDIYDEPPEEEELYEQPSDDSGGAVVIHPMSHQREARLSSDNSVDYIDDRNPRNRVTNGQQVIVPCPPWPPKQGRRAPPPIPQDSPDFYEELPQTEEEYELPANGSDQQETYEVADNTASPELYDIPDQETQTEETYEITGPDDGQETYEMPDQSPALPPRPGRSPFKPPSSASKPVTMTTTPKPSLPTKPSGKIGPIPPINKPAAPAKKPLISQKPRIQVPIPEKELPRRDTKGPRPTSFVPNLPPRVENNNMPTSASSIGRSQSCVKKPQPSTMDDPGVRSRFPFGEISGRQTSPAVGAGGGKRRSTPCAVDDDTPPPPPRPLPKPSGQWPPGASSGINKVPPKPPRISDSDCQDGPFPPLNQLNMQQTERPLPSRPQSKAAVDEMKDAPWFQGPLDRKAAENALKSFSRNGAFLVRNSSRDANNFSMSLYHEREVRHLRIPRTKDGKFVLGDSGVTQFNSIPELVDHHTQHHVELKAGGATILTVPCPFRKS